MKVTWMQALRGCAAKQRLYKGPEEECLCLKFIYSSPYRTKLSEAFMHHTIAS